VQSPARQEPEVQPDLLEQDLQDIRVQLAKQRLMVQLDPRVLWELQECKETRTQIRGQRVRREAPDLSVLGVQLDRKDLHQTQAPLGPEYGRDPRGRQGTQGLQEQPQIQGQPDRRDERGQLDERVSQGQQAPPELFRREPQDERDGQAPRDPLEFRGRRAIRVSRDRTQISREQRAQRDILASRATRGPQDPRGTREQEPLAQRARRE
jgi:hypothetical protein